MERDKKKNKVLAHKKIVSRVVAKQYVGDLKGHAYQLLADTGFFGNMFKEVVLEQNVMPWFYGEVEKYVKLYQENLKFPDNFV